MSKDKKTRCKRSICSASETVKKPADAAFLTC